MRLCPGRSFRFGDYRLFRARQEYNEASSGLSGSRPTIDDLNRPAMLVHDFRYDREPEAYTAFLRREKWIENLLAQLDGNSRTRIRHPHLDASRIASHAVGDRNAEPAAGRAHGIVGVLYEIDKNLFAEIFIYP